jgi:hypothetical protein
MVKRHYSSQAGSGVGWLDKVHFFNQSTGIVFNALSGACFYTTNRRKDTTAWTFVVINSDGGGLQAILMPRQTATYTQQEFILQRAPTLE